MKNCRNCKYRRTMGPHQLPKCDLTGLFITDPDGCLGWEEKEKKK